MTSDKDATIKFAKDLRDKVSNLIVAFPGHVHGLRNQYSKLDLAITLAEEYGQYDQEHFNKILTSVRDYIVRMVSGK